VRRDRDMPTRLLIDVSTIIPAVLALLLASVAHRR
jgi:hypothetical protein